MPLRGSVKEHERFVFLPLTGVEKGRENLSCAPSARSSKARHAPCVSSARGTCGSRSRCASSIPRAGTARAAPQHVDEPLKKRKEGEVRLRRPFVGGHMSPVIDSISARSRLRSVVLAGLPPVTLSSPLISSSRKTRAVVTV